MKATSSSKIYLAVIVPADANKVTVEDVHALRATINAKDE